MRTKKSYSAPKLASESRTRTFIFSLVVLLLFGLFEIYNATTFYSLRVYGSPYKFALLHLGWLLLGSLGFFLFYRVPYAFWKSWSTKLFVFALIPLTFLALLGVFTFQFHILHCSSSIAFAPCINGAYRWFHLNPPPLPRMPLVGILSFQPSEFAKLALVIFSSALISRLEREKNLSPWEFLFRFFVPVGVIVFLVLLQPNMSTSSLLLFTSLGIYFGSKAPLKPVLLLAPVLLGLLFLFIFSSPYRRQRFITFASPDSSAELTTNYHTHQIMIALGSGGFLGVGVGQSRQKYQYLPEVASDSIFAIMGEELGFVGAVSFLLFFLFFLYQGFAVAGQVRDPFPRSIVVGVMTWVGLQAFINLMAMVKLIPLTGIPIPLVSYGGSSLFFVLCGLGLVANISQRAK